MKKPTIEAPHPDVRIIKPDYALKQRIGISLRTVFTPERIRAAQAIFDQGKDQLLLECKNTIHTLRFLCQEHLDKPTAIPSKELARLAATVKGSAGMAGYPIATTMADEMLGFLSEIKAMDVAALRLTLVIADAINAVFNEGRTAKTDMLSEAVMKEVGENIRDYLAARA